MNYSDKHVAAQSAVKDLLSSIDAKSGNNSNYKLGYLKAMLVSLASRESAVFEDVIVTTDWIRNQTNQETTNEV